MQCHSLNVSAMIMINLIPYLEGSSFVGVNFLSAETSAFIIATYKGYKGSILNSGTLIGNGSTTITGYSYIYGEVVHIKGSAGHQVDVNQKSYIKEYFSDCGAVKGACDHWEMGGLKAQDP